MKIIKIWPIFCLFAFTFVDAASESKPWGEYGHKAYYKIRGDVMSIDVEKTYNSEPYKLQKAINFLEATTACFCRRAYILRFDYFEAMLNAISEVGYEPCTSDNGGLSSSWMFSAMWSGPSKIGLFKEKFPNVKEIVLYTSSGRVVRFEIVPEKYERFLKTLEDNGLHLSTCCHIP